MRYPAPLLAVLMALALVRHGAAVCYSTDFNVWSYGNQANFNSYRSNFEDTGHRPVYATFYTGSGAIIYVNAVMAKKQGGSYELRQNVKEAAYIDLEWPTGSCIDWISAHTNTGAHYISDVIESGCTHQQYRVVGMTGTTFREKWLELHNNGYTLRSMAAYGTCE